MGWVGREILEGGDIYTFMADSYCCRNEHSIMQQFFSNYFFFKLKWYIENYCLPITYKQYNNAKLHLSERHKVLTLPDLFPNLSQQASLEKSLYSEGSL